ncbi:MAG TPA: histidine kinase dimerization/phospho-acceptor domain-containing protein, partial [Terriglobia bacterium]|nr:histidine kinase dimerization/phospho-acceptor domain-containing protein [Terriglobia bacterium]
MGLVCALAAILVVLAILQVRGSNQVSQAERERMQANLHTAVTRFRRDFYLELLHVCWAFQTVTPKSDSGTLQAYADRYDDWMGASAHPDLVGSLFIWKAPFKGASPLFQLNPALGKFQPASWPQDFARLRQQLKRQGAAASRLDASALEEQWVIDEKIPALYHPLLSHPGSAKAINDFLIVRLNMNFIQQVLLPVLADRYFRGPEGFTYRVTVVSGDHPGKIIYQSIPTAAAKTTTAADAVADLIPAHGKRLLRSSFKEQLRAPEPESEEEPDGGVSSAQDSRAFAPQGQRRFYPLILQSEGSAGWKLIARHRLGSVDAAVLSLRRHNLAVSFGVLLLLAASMALVVISAQRAHRLARLQMDFVAGVSHELRTPLAVICSAAENLADGVVGAREQVKNYGALIRTEGRRLSEMVEQILVFAAGQAGRHSYERRPAAVTGIIETALAHARPALDAAGTVVEKRFEADLPLVMADPAAVGRCIQNLVSNAIKYGGAPPWLGIRTEKSEGPRGAEVLVHVQDHGVGIDPQDMPHIFEPFY